MVLSLYVTWPLATFNIPSLFCMFSILIIVCHGEFLFSSSLFDVLYAFTLNRHLLL